MASNKNFSNYVSDLDLFLQDYDKKHPGLSRSQQLEIIKSQRIYQLRDNATVSESSSKLWEGF